MTGDWLTADDIIKLIDLMVLKLGEDAFAHNGKSHLYARLSDVILNALPDNFIDNDARAKAWARDHGATLIDDTPVGAFLVNFEGIGVYKYFLRKHKVDNPALAIIEPQKVWRHASRLFIASLWGDVTTTICGGYRGGAFYELELPTSANPDHMDMSISELMQALVNPRKRPINTVNYFPFDDVKTLYTPDDYEDANQFVGIAEQLMAFNESVRLADPAYVRKALRLASKEALEAPIKAFRYFLDSQERFHLDRALVLMDPLRPPHPFFLKGAAERLERKVRLLGKYEEKICCRIRKEISCLREPFHTSDIFGADGCAFSLR